MGSESQIRSPLEPPTPATLVWLRGVVTSTDVDQNLADGAVLDGIMRVRSALERKAVEWKPDVLSDFERAVFDRRSDVGNSLVFRRAGTVYTRTNW